MARVQYGGGVTEFTGSLAGNTFQRNRSGTIARTRVNRARATTSKMARAQAQTFDLLRLWHDLNPTSQVLWNDFATAHPHTNIYGQEKTLSGFNWFVSINSNRMLVGDFPLTDPPSFDLPSAPATFEITFDATHVYITALPVSRDTGNFLVIYTTPPLQGTTLSFRASLRSTLILPTDNYTGLDITTEWNNAHGLSWPMGAAAKCNVGGMFYTIFNESGLTQPALFAIAGFENP